MRAQTRRLALLVIPIALALFAFIGTTPASEEETRDRAVALMRGGDDQGALKLAEAYVLRADPQRARCHELFHEIGRAAPVDRMSVNDLLTRAAEQIPVFYDACEAGYLHMLMTQEMRLTGPDLAPSPRACPEISVIVGAPDLVMCLHGAGHAFGELINDGRMSYDEAFARCAALPLMVGATLATEQIACLDGIGMSLGATIFGDPDPAIVLARSSGRVCLIVSGDRRTACIDRFSERYVVQETDRLGASAFATWSEICAPMSGYFRFRCLADLGTASAQIGGVSSLLVVCAEREDCLAAGAETIARSSESGPALAACDRAIGELACAELFGRLADREPFCAAMAPDLAARCRELTYRARPTPDLPGDPGA